MTSHYVMSNADWKKIPSPQALDEVDFRHASHNVVSAFSLCREAERYLTQNFTAAVHSAVDYERRLMNVRIVGHLLNFSPSDVAAAFITKSIVSAYDDDTEGTTGARAEGIIKLGEFFDKHLLRSFRKFKGPTLRSSQHPSRPSFNLDAEQVKKMLTENTLSHQNARELALARDDYCCMLAGWMDTDYWRTVYSKKYPSAEIDAADTELAHIFSESTNTNLKDENELAYAASAWKILDSFGFGSILEELQGSNMHRLENVLTLSQNAHSWFDKLQLWFEAIPGKPNCYEIKSSNPLGVFGLGNFPKATFTSHVTNPPYPLPDPRYLHIHASCCKVAHLSGASGLYDRLEKDSESQPDADSPSFAVVLRARLELMSPPRFEQYLEAV